MSSILRIIQERRSERGQFDRDKKISNEDLKKILEAARWAPTAHNMQNFEILVIDDKNLIKDISTIRSMPSEEFIRENFLYLSHSQEELEKRKVGILGTQFPKKWQDASTLDEAVKERAPTELSSTVRGGQTILIVLYDSTKRAPASDGDVLGFLSLGCVMENIWLMAQELGISVHIMSAFNGVSEEFKKMLEIPWNMDIGLTCKLGYPAEETPHAKRIRRDIDDFTHRNIYGQKGLGI